MRVLFFTWGLIAKDLSTIHFFGVKRDLCAVHLVYYTPTILQQWQLILSQCEYGIIKG